MHTDHPEHSLIGVKDTRGATLLLQALQDEHWMVRAQAVEMLGALAHPAGVDALETATTDDPDAEVHRAAVTTLAQLAPGRAIPPLLLATQDNDPWVRGEAVAVWGKIGDVRVGIEPHLRPLLADTDEEVREVTRLTIATLERGKD